MATAIVFSIIIYNFCYLAEYSLIILFEINGKLEISFYNIFYFLFNC